MKHLAAIQQLTAIMSAQPGAQSLVPTAPRVETATPPRVAVAASPRVATTLNTITSPCTIRLLPSVHQQVTRNINPFQILSDNNDDECDDVMVVVSNRSPRTPLQILHDNHVPPAIPTTMPWPPTRCSHVIKKTKPTTDPTFICNPNHHNATFHPAATDNPTFEATIAPTSSCDPITTSKFLTSQMSAYSIILDPTVCPTC